MTMYASKTPRDLNRDPLPWHVSLTPSRGGNGRWREWRGAASSWDDALVRAEDVHPGWTAHTGGLIPRPEFDHVQHNEPNPILVFARAYCTERFGGTLLVRSILWGFDDLPVVEGATVEQRVHARRVLTRLARFAEES